jgi:hypothetical protein
VYAIVTGISKESSTVVELSKAVTSKTTFDALDIDDGLLVVPKTLSESIPFIWITTVDDVAVKSGGVVTVIDFPFSVSDVVEVEETVAVVVVAESVEATHPVVVNRLLVEVA